MSIRISADIGGTFTDLQFLDTATRRIFEHKTPSTPANPADGLFRGILEAAAILGFSMSDVDLLLHGTTIATNAVLERKLPRAAFVTTAGFEDVVEIGRHMRNDVYGIRPEKRTLLVPRSDRIGLAERVDAQGRVVRPLEAQGVRNAIATIREKSIGVVAVGFLNAFRNTAHEEMVRDIFATEAPEIIVGLSIDVSPEIREYERFSTAILNAMLIPVVSNYVEQLAARADAEGLTAPILLLQSNGGTCGLAQAARYPAKLLLSGPCGGTTAVEYLSRALDMPNLVSLDLGGTSCDIAVITDGRSKMVGEADVDGLAVRLPMIDIRTIGAGGGSIAHGDAAGRLTVGPESAGAQPGPACYRRGGTRPTLTDANLVLGRLDPDEFLRGEMILDTNLAEGALRTKVAEPLGLDLDTAAEGVVRIAVSNMVTATRLSLFEHGLDPQDFALVSFGGAAGLHAAEVANELGINRILFPKCASTLSAFGMLWADVQHDTARSDLQPLTHASAEDINRHVKAMRREGEAALAADRIVPEKHRYELSADLRYLGQGFELPVTLPDGEIGPGEIDAMIATFHATHHDVFSHADPSGTVELVTLRQTAKGLLDHPLPEATQIEGVEAATTRRVHVDGAWQQIPVLHRSALCHAHEGPFVLREAYTSILIPGGWRLTLLPSGDALASAISENVS